jgi:histidyl-tRNA synthetase
MMSQIPRGLRDLTPEESERFERVRDSFKESCRLYGFRLMEPSPMEMLQTLEAKSGPGIRNEIYHFRDKAGRSLGLRFDLTVGLTRYACADRAAPLPVKLASFSGVFRYDEPQHGRYRWFYQWDVETYGSPNVEADVEMMDFTNSYLRSCGLKNGIIRVGDRRVVQEFIEKKLGRTGSEAEELMRALDKVQKKSATELVEEYTQKGFKIDEVQSVLSFGNLEGTPDEIVSKLNELGLNSANNIIELASLLDSANVRHEFSLRIVRGIDYYTSTVFEVYDPGRSDLGAIAGGGRFDRLPRVFGRDDLPATGVAGGVERLMLALDGTSPQREPARVYVACTDGMHKDALRVAAMVRAEGQPAVFDLQRRSLSKQLEVAAKQNVEFVIIVAPEEYSQGKVRLRRMKDRTESTVPLSQLGSELSK